MKMFWKCLLFYILIFLSSSTADKLYPNKDVFVQTTDLSQDDSIDYKLPTSVKPTSYEIMLIPHLPDNFTFNGFVQITAKIETNTKTITLHVGKLSITHVAVAKQDIPIEVINKTYDSITEKYTLFIPREFNKGDEVVIAFTYTGVLSDNMIGFYRSSYYDRSGKLKWLAATQFQTTHARHAFPCFDEPSFKATFTIRISRKRDYISLSNMPRNYTSEMNVTDNKVWDVFHESVPMSTYLVAFVVSEFKSLNHSVQYVAWARPSVINQAEYAWTIGSQALELFDKMFQHEYHLPKMEMVAVPDFKIGAMENWGLVTFREPLMLYDEEESSTPAQQLVASVVVHEFTHMWFGNLVTPEWWSYLWLSEGFARYFEYFGTAKIETSWKMEEQFIVEQHQPALIVDGLESSRPMTREVSNQLQIEEIGDSITYQKGASIVRMINHTYGDSVFRSALISYINNNKETGLGHPDKLWKAIQDHVTSSNLNQNLLVNTTMDTWTMQAGYPVISVTINKENISVTQERFFLRNLDKTPNTTTWMVPLTWTRQNESNFTNTVVQMWLSNEKDTIYLKVDPEDWIIFNIQSSGFYRVNYINGWRRIFKTLYSISYEQIHVLNRANIVDDLLNLGRAGYQDYDTVLDGITYLTRETNYLPFKAAFNGLDYLNKRFTGHEEYSLFKKYVLSLINDRRKELKYEDKKSDDRLTVLLRREVNKWACNLEDQECTTIYLFKFRKWKQDKVPIKPNERATAYCVAMRHGTPEDWEFLWTKYKTSNYPADQVVIINALGCSENTEILEKYLGYAISGYETSRIHKHDSTSVFAAVYNSGLIGAEYVLDFVERHLKEMEKYYEGQSTIASILSGASQRFSMDKLVNKFENFIKKHKEDLKSIEKSLESSLKLAKYELDWYKIKSPSIIRWLRGYIDNEPIKYRLPKGIKPTKYDIYIVPYLENTNFSGHVKIEAKVEQPTSQIVLHSILDIKHNTMNITANDKKINNHKGKSVSKYDFYVIDLDTELSIGTNLIIEIEYTGHMNPSELRGFYKSSYVDDNGKKRLLAATHLEPVGARKMFPCFDEPALKANFTVRVVVPFKYSAYSNMGWKLKEILNNTSELYTFNESVNMSTYLVAVIISDFELAEEIIEGRKFGVLARPNAINQSRYALSVMSPLVNFFETTFGQPYSISKLHMAALPDFPSGAGENWGLITYRESYLLYDANHSSVTSKQTIANVIAHEISHQWFGNLVTLSFWDYLWLNEGFARYFEYHAPSRVLNNTALEYQFVVDELHTALSADSSISTHSLNHAVYSPAEIRSKFDTITYAKGASIIRMMEKTYGTKVLYDAFSYYLNERKYDTATPEDLYKALEMKTKHNNISAIWETWTSQAGYPVVQVNISRHNEITYITLGQKRFYLKKPTYNLNENPRQSDTWYIPITWSLVDHWQFNDTTPKLWLTNATQTVQVGDKFRILNVQQSGYYRVNYDDNHWEYLIEHLKARHIEYDSIHEINRAALVDDLFNLARAGDVPYRYVISAMTYLQNETNYLPWLAFYRNLPYLNDRFREGVIEDKYKKYIVSIITPLYEQLGFNDNKDDNYTTILLRTHTRKWACEFDVKDCKYTALRYFVEQYRRKRTPVPPNYRSVVYCTAMKLDVTNSTYEMLWEEYLNSNVVSDKLVILNSLACSPKKQVLEQLLLNAITENSIRYQDSAKVFSSVYSASSIGVEAVISTIRNHYDSMLRQNYNDYKKIAAIVNNLASKVSNNLYNQYQDLLEWLLANKEEFVKHVKSYVENANYEIEWYRKYGPVIFEELDRLFPSETYRLPDMLYPEKYNLTIEPNIPEGTFEGKVQICMTAKSTIDNKPYIILNSHDLVNKAIRVYNMIDSCEPESMKTPIKVTNWSLNPETQQLKIYLERFISMEKISVEIEFSGNLSDDMKGFYRSSYLDESGELQWLAATHFQPTHARRVFPCFDEPRFKSQFTINIRRPRDYIALSNMPLLKRSYEYEETDKDYVWDIFEETKEVAKIPTYLVAFVISKNFTSTSTDERVRVVTRPEFKNYTVYAQYIGKTVLETLEWYHLMLFEKVLKKLDLVGIPDLAMGATENWGLATFREHALVYHEDETPVSYKKSMITTIAHELSHIWYGNLVTCEWWDYVWLNEGLPQYMQWHIYPETGYNFPHLFVVYELQPALLKATSPNQPSMTRSVKTPEDINNIFDYVTYGKSASVLRMIFEALDILKHGRNALSDYITNQMKNSNGLARPTDLWKMLDSHHGSITIKNRNISVEEIMDSWTNQEGYPVVHAKYNGSVLQLRQSEMVGIHGDNTFFWIPITVYLSDDDKNHLTLRNKLWLGPEPESVYINPGNNWFIVNYQQTGFYRVTYDRNSWIKLINELNSTRFESIHVLNRAQIIDDLFSLARAYGEYNYEITYDLVLDATIYLKRETHHLPWKAFFNSMSYIYERYEENEYLDILRHYVLTLISSLYDQLGFYDQAYCCTPLEQLNRELILQWACKLNEKNCTEQSVIMFNDWIAGNTSVPPNTRQAVYCTAVRESNTNTEWDVLWDKYIQTNFPSEKKIMINALGCSMDATKLNTYLENAVNNSANPVIRKHDVKAVFTSVCSASQLGVDVALDFLITNINRVSDYFGESKNVVALFEEVASHISSNAQYNKLKSFAEVHKLRLNAALNLAKNNLDWFKHYHYTIDDWLRKFEEETQPKQDDKPQPDDAVRAESLSLIFTIFVTLISYFLS